MKIYTTLYRVATIILIDNKFTYYNYSYRGLLNGIWCVQNDVSLMEFDVSIQSNSNTPFSIYTTKLSFNHSSLIQLHKLTLHIIHN